MTGRDVRLLGSIEVVDDGGATVDLGGPKPRAVFAMLALVPGEVVSVDRLVDGVWGSEAPGSARRSLQTYVSSLRKTLGTDAIQQRGAGYVLDVADGQVDIERFRALAAEARDTDGPAERLRLLDRALELVRGAPLEGVGDAPFADTARPGLEEEVLDVTERRLDTLLELGRDREVIRDLQELVVTHPLREGFRAQLMLAQYRAGRQAAALEVYEQTRETLAEELGIDPSPQLQELHQRILRQDPSLQADTPEAAAADRVPSSDLAAPSELSSRELVGREAEVERLHTILSDTTAGRPRVVLLGGEAGIGKSRLLAALLDGAERRGYRAMMGHCVDLGDSALPFAPIAQVLRAFERRSDPEEVDEVLGRSRPELARIVPELAEEGASGLAVDADSQRAVVFAAVLDTLDRMSQQRPALLAVEDIHWADRSTLDLLVYLARNLSVERLVLVATFRTDELHRRHPLRRPLAELTRLPQVERLDLAPFGRQAVADQLERILGDEPDEGLVDRITERSGGNPFYVEELLAAGGAAGPPGADDLPPALHDVVADRVEQLSDDTREVVAVAAVAGERVEHRLLDAVDRVGSGLVGALREAVEHHVLVPEGEGYRFRHALVREVIYDDLLPGERSSLHRVIAETLRSNPHVAVGGREHVDAELAHHYTVANDLEQAFEASVRAAERATTTAAYTEALRHYERALSLWDEVRDQGGTREQAELLEAAAEAAYLAAEGRRAATLMEEALDLSTAHFTPTERALRLERLSRFRSLSGDYDGARKALDLALELVSEDPPTAARARILATYAQRRWEFSPEEGLEVADEAVQIARRVGDRVTEAAALVTVGMTLGALGEVDEGLEHLRAARRIASEEDEPLAEIRASEALTIILIRGARASEAADIALETLERTRELGIERLEGPTMAGMATSAMFWSGRWDEALDLVEHVVGGTWGDSWLLFLQGRLRAHRGEFEEAHRLLDRAETIRPGDPKYFAGWLALAALERDLERGHELVLGRVDLSREAHGATDNQLRAMALQIEADRLHAADHDVDEGEIRELADQLLSETGDELAAGIAYTEPWRLTAVAEHSRIVDHPSPDTWREARDAWQELDWPYQTAYATYRLAEAELAAGSDDVGELARSAANTARELGAAPLLGKIRELVERVGVDLSDGQ
ncbi:MAG: BTAD domain-containing putative transcriptional regulator [Nitriliruptorales bacterium]|nr:BTAD domain-containing putative transcriptional regulator [Nitriliruptorales bacterium]